MKTKLMAGLAAMLTVGSAQAYITHQGSFAYELLDFSGSYGSVLAPTNPGGCGVGSSHDARCDPMYFLGGIGGQLTVTAPGSPMAYQDLPRTDRGLGVVANMNSTTDTFISGGEVLTLTFANIVNLVGYHIYQKGSAAGPDQFKVSTDGGLNWSSGRNFDSVVYTTNGGRWFTNSNTFSFKAADNEAFYVGAVKITSAVPEPQTYALMLAGLAAVGFAARRRRARH